MKSIVLPAGTEHVQFGELAHLIADALWPDAGPDDDSMTNAFARINLDAELARAVDSGALPVKDPLTLGPHTYPVGYALKTALVTVDDLQRFVSDRGLSVIVETPEPQAADAPAAKSKAVRGITKQRVIAAFEGLHFDSDARWSKALADKSIEWLKPCKVVPGSKSASALWNPVLIGCALLDKKITLKRLDAVFNLTLKDWADEWLEATARERD